MFSQLGLTSICAHVQIVLIWRCSTFKIDRYELRFFFMAGVHRVSVRLDNEPVATG